jgi:hypothetical protein
MSWMMTQSKKFIQGQNVHHSSKHMHASKERAREVEKRVKEMHEHMDEGWMRLREFTASMGAIESISSLK